ncbi:MAG: phosphomethylpyrimidine synthase [Thermoprotei archaeon ex4572_64]|nr:MAG: phosphomethylpyrimidine synthase [Thermoprotei archaeon ex4572_64]
MSTLVRIAKQGTITDEFRELAKIEGLSPEKIRDRIASGRIVITRNVVRRERVKTTGIGCGLRTKVNVNVGTSEYVCNLDMEIEKVGIALRHGADTIMDLSVGGDLNEIRRTLMRYSEPLPLGTVPIYQVFVEACRKRGGGAYFTVDDLLNTIELHLKDGVDFMTLHASLTKDLIVKAIKSERVIPIVSRGGDMIAGWVLHNGDENPLWKYFDNILEMFTQYDAVISLGDALRPGAIHDAHDELHIAELLNTARLVKRAREYGVQVIVEGPGHMPLNEIIWDVKLMKKLTRGAPYYVLGPLPTDIAAPYDHVASAIGAALAAAAGADFLCYLTPAEHLSIPTPEQVKEGLIAHKIAAHVADIVKYGGKVASWDLELSRYRNELDWKNMIAKLMNPEDAWKVYTQFGEPKGKPCTMCGNYCPVLMFKQQSQKYLKERGKNHTS